MRAKWITLQQIVLGLALLAALCWNLAQANEIKGLQLSDGATGTRAELQLQGEVAFKTMTLSNPDRFVVDFPDTAVGRTLQLPSPMGAIKAVRTGKPTPGTTRIVFDLASPIAPLKPRIERGADGVRLVLEWPGDGAKPVAAAAPTPKMPQTTAAAPSSTIKPAAASAVPPVVTVPTPATPTIVDKTAPSSPATLLSQGSTIAGSTIAGATTIPNPTASNPTASNPSAAVAVPPVDSAIKSVVVPEPSAIPPASAGKTLRDLRVGTRPLVIAIDPGHGGQDPGAIGPSGRYEKHVVLAISKELARQINATPGMRAYLIRDTDVYVERPQRARKARAAKADMFVSIHADAAENRSAWGSSVYVLSTRGASSQHARWLANKENASDLVGGVRLTRDTLSNVLLDLAQSGHMKASQDAAGYVLDGLKQLGKTHKPQIEFANFEVLRNSDMPAMLVETGFISNADEEKRLFDPNHQRKIAAAVLNGIQSYFTRQPPPGTVFAARAKAGEATVVASAAAANAVVTGGSP
ncbi:MAG: N-acetylmuramoyl-L-alanine amidase [Pseudomonadota bacterium]